MKFINRLLPCNFKLLFKIICCNCMRPNHSIAITKLSIDCHFLYVHILFFTIVFLFNMLTSYLKIFKDDSKSLSSSKTSPSHLRTQIRHLGETLYLILLMKASNLSISQLLLSNSYNCLSFSIFIISYDRFCKSKKLDF
jgi:hypothetical protein